MSDLTREQIEFIRFRAEGRGPFHKSAENQEVLALCDMALRSLVPSATAATSEFVMVPREPTDAMVAAYLKAQREDCDGQDRFIGALPQGGVQQACKAGYRALIAAAPQAAPVEKGAIRDAALEEAAKEVDWHACRYLDSNLNSIAAGIRALKGPRMKGGEPK